ncbi:HD domain-containing protein [Methylobacterium sp. J-072]|uniref:HD-GYP domain-containing protein n=1 Tax=Methylobacterium sp. J-072 TaxID=2836651 RepID=UPI001FBB4F55|nr:HD domain-containing phosphohydrolase [Methylobacterium sp. J-072]MCJ2094001.1 HD domain-containing protein [Methylobacterium sp. J-072]
MGELLLITDDIHRGRRLSREFGTCRPCHVLDLYDDVLPALDPALIVSDVEALTSEAIVRLRRTLAQLRGEDVPYLFLVHGNTARSEAQARVLGATTTAGVQQMLGAVERLQGTSIPVLARTRAAEARQFFQHALFSGQPITPAVADVGTELVVRAVSDTGIHDWVRAVQQFDDATHQHCLLVAALAAVFSGTLGLRPADRHRLTRAALLHDVGKIHVPIEILNKPGRLTHSETAIMRTHAERGHAMLVGAGFDDGLLAAVRSHHEMIDGSGYPDGLRGWEVSDFVRLMTICDVYGALIERRPYRAPMHGAKAYTVLEEMAGRLDAVLVRAFQPIAAAFDPTMLKAAHDQALISCPRQTTTF